MLTTISGEPVVPRCIARKAVLVLISPTVRTPLTVRRPWWVRLTHQIAFGGSSLAILGRLLGARTLFAVVRQTGPVSLVFRESGARLCYMTSRTFSKCLRQ